MLNYIVAICCATCSYSCVAADKISTDTACAVHLQLQSFLFQTVLSLYFGITVMFLIKVTSTF